MQSIQENTFTEPISPSIVTAENKATLGSEIESTRWGWFPAIALLDAFALMMTATAYTLQRNSSQWGAVLFWVSLLIIFVPIAYRLLSSSIARRERVGLVVVLG
ncbi:MAG: hypothetical protein H0X30_33290, partial [Anaerolineae bacterium]|nr:hypothetical protein [Anaerolineae bacterium]